MMDGTELKAKIKRFARLLDQGDALLIGAGSGLSVDAGVDYLDTRSFAEKYPAMLQYGFSSNAELMGFDQGSDPGLYWGYYLAHGRNMRFGTSEQAVYKLLLDLAGMQEKNFVITTNVDAFFQRNGFEENRIYTPQGDYGRIQCLKPCSDHAWPSEQLINGLLPLVDPVTGRLPLDQVPSCPNCGGPVFYNVRGGGWFVDAPYQDQYKKYRKWVQETMGRRLLLIEIGAGFHTPVWIRWPFEKITHDNPKSHLVRINPEDADVPVDIANRSICFSNRAIDVIKGTTDYLKQKLGT